MHRVPCGAGTAPLSDRFDMKKLVLILAAVLTAIVWYVYHDPRLSGEVEKEIKQLIPSKQKTTTVYKWRDTSGNWQITDHPPPAGTRFETLEYQSNTNVMPSEAITGKKPD
jgi:hypothetical protein